MLSTFNNDLPDDLYKEVASAKDSDIKQIGIDWCIAQSKELMQRGVPVLNYYTMGKSDAVKKVASQLF